MHRRDFSRVLAGGVLAAGAIPAALSPPAVLAEAKASFLRFSVMLWTVYKNLPFEQRIEKVAEAGYHAVELVDEYEKWTPEDFRKASAKLRSLDIKVDAMAGDWTGIADPQARDKFLADLRRLVPIAEQLECPAIIVLSGNRVEGLSQQAHHQSCVDGLKAAA